MTPSLVRNTIAHVARAAVLGRDSLAVRRAIRLLSSTAVAISFLLSSANASTTDQLLANAVFPDPVYPPVGVCNGGLISEMNRQLVFGKGYGSRPGYDNALVLITPASAPDDVQAVIAFIRLDDRPLQYALADAPHWFLYPSVSVGPHSAVIGTMYLMKTGEIRQVRVVRNCFEQPYTH